MKFTSWLLLQVVLGAALLGCSARALGQNCKEMVYSHENQIDPKTIELRRIQGTAVDPNGMVIPQLCVGIFTESEHKLMRYTQSDDTGVFVVDTNGLPDGDYRLVGKIVGFCPANAMLRIKSHTHKKRRLLLRMNVRGIDSCSSVGLDKK